MKSLIKTLLLVIITTNLTFGQINLPQKQKNEFLNDLVTSFENEFLWTEKGKQIAKELDAKIKNSDYSKIAEADIFVETLNRDLYILSNDLHLKVDLYEAEQEKSSITSKSKMKPVIQKELVTEGIYYLKFDVFPNLSKEFEKEIDNLMSSLEGSRSIIIDLRDNSGGSDETVNHLIGYFFSEEKKLGTSYQWNKPPQEIWAVPKAQSKTLSGVRLIILTSQSTFSAAEIFTQRLQLHDRAVVIGERTPGAAHRTMTYLMNDVFLLHWPYERSEHVVDNKDLEGIGIIPDYLVHYDKAIDESIKIAKGIKVEKEHSIAIPQSAQLIGDLIEALNSNSDNSINEFVDKNVTLNHQETVSRTLQKFKTVWNDSFEAKIVNIHNLPESNFRIFIETVYGVKQMKIALNGSNKIEKIMMR